MNTAPLTFNWHDEDENSFLKWLVPHVISASDREEEFEALSESTDNWRNVALTMQINGVDVDTDHFIDSLRRNMEHWAKDEARRLTAEVIDLDDLRTSIETAEKALIDHVRGEFSRRGIELPADNDNW